MPQTPIRLRNRFATDGGLESVLYEARNASTASNALSHERLRDEWVRRRQASMLRRGRACRARNLRRRHLADVLV